MIDRITKDEFGTSAPLAQNRLLGAGMGGLTVLSLFDGNHIFCLVSIVDDCIFADGNKFRKI